MLIHKSSCVHIVCFSFVVSQVPWVAEVGTFPIHSMSLLVGCVSQPNRNPALPLNACEAYHPRSTTLTRSRTNEIRAPSQQLQPRSARLRHLLLLPTNDKAHARCFLLEQYLVLACWKCLSSPPDVLLVVRGPPQNCTKTGFFRLADLQGVRTRASHGLHWRDPLHGASVGRHRRAGGQEGGALPQLHARAVLPQALQHLAGVVWRAAPHLPPRRHRLLLPQLPVACGLPAYERSPRPAGVLPVGSARRRPRPAHGLQGVGLVHRTVHRLSSAVWRRKSAESGRSWFTWLVGEGWVWSPTQRASAMCLLS